MCWTKWTAPAFQWASKQGQSWIECWSWLQCFYFQTCSQKFANQWNVGVQSRRAISDHCLFVFLVEVVAGMLYFSVHLLCSTKYIGFCMKHVLLCLSWIEAACCIVVWMHSSMLRLCQHLVKLPRPVKFWKGYLLGLYALVNFILLVFNSSLGGL